MPVVPVLPVVPPVPGVVALLLAWLVVEKTTPATTIAPATMAICVAPLRAAD